MYTVQAYIHNETDQPLTLLSSEVPDGHWSWPPPATIAAKSVIAVRTRADSILTGTQGRATYRIGDAAEQTLYVHWNNPFVGSNSFDANTDATHYAYWSASPGNQPVAHFVLRPAGTVLTGFLPSSDGFKFSNSDWPDPTPYSLPPLRGSVLDNKYGNAGSGLCGGMVFSALDYFSRNLQIPDDPVPPPGEQYALFKDLVIRLFDTFTVENISLTLKLMNPLYPDGDEDGLGALGLANGRAAVMAFEEWPLIRADIDSGMPSPMMIVTIKSAWPGDLGECHQVLAYGYDVSGHDVALHVYDPNQPMADGVRISFADGDVSQRLDVHDDLGLADDDGNHRPVYCFFRLAYTSKIPRKVTSPKPSPWEREHRGVWLETFLPTTTLADGPPLESGQIELAVPPDCGNQTFPYVVRAQSQRVAARAHVHGYADPVLAWELAGQPVVPGDGRSLTVSSVFPVDEYDAADTSGSVGPVTVTTSTDSNTVYATNASGAENISFAVRVTCRERNDPASATDAMVVLDLIGRAFTVDGFTEAAGDCMRAYLDSITSAEPSVKAVRDLIMVQLNRPPDPLWDPDPTYAEIGAELTRDDPVEAALALELKAPDFSAPALWRPGLDLQAPQIDANPF